MTKQQEQKRVKDDIKELFRHADVANKEMGDIKTHIGVISNDIKWMKSAFDKHVIDENQEFTNIKTLISEIKLGIPPWVTGVVSLAVALIVYLLTK